MTRSREQLRRELWLEDGERCHYCRTEMLLTDATFEHIVPRAFGGTWHRWNLVIACARCNNELQDAVRKCECRKCVRALQRFHQVVRPSRAEIEPVRRDVIVEVPVDVAGVVEALRERITRAETMIETLEDRDSQHGAALRGKCGAYREAIQLLLAPSRRLQESFDVGALTG